MHHSLGPKHVCYRTEMIPGTVACAVIMQMGGWILRNSWIIKETLPMMVIHALRACKSADSYKNQYKIITIDEKFFSLNTRLS